MDERFIFPVVSPELMAKVQRVPKENKTKRKGEVWLAGFLATLTLLLMLFFAMTMISTYREYTHFQERERRVAAELAQVRNEFARREAYLNRLLNDPEFLERVARERLGYARPDELVFRFEN